MAIFKNTPPVVTDGLVLYLDAANRQSYVSGSTTWNNLSGGISGSLINGPAFSNVNGGVITFDGSNDYCITTPTPPSLQGNPSFTVEGWFKRNSTKNTAATWGIGGENSTQGINSYNTGTDLISIDLWGTSTYSTGQTYSLTDWKHITWTYNGGGFTTSNIIIYINTVPYTGANLTINRGGSGTPNINANGIVLARAGALSNQYYYPANIANFKIYNRALPQAEVLQNYNATKQRFNLT
jgi:hypothetical protein